MPGLPLGTPMMSSQQVPSQPVTAARVIVRAVVGEAVRASVGAALATVPGPAGVTAPWAVPADVSATVRGGAHFTNHRRRRDLQ